MVLNSLLDQAEIDREKNVVIEEIKRHKDTRRRGSRPAGANDLEGSSARQLGNRQRVGRQKKSRARLWLSICGSCISPIRW